MSSLSKIYACQQTPLNIETWKPFFKITLTFYRHAHWESLKERLKSYEIES